ncbi:hypothetical protein GY31_08380 [Lysinibacillus sphaericus]|uniref:Uncharacterized protein n=1 Tax=Lysinibacillus sphaericus TaxID=1421 RepID=A0A2S5D316_LYSSH|nr:hypothetical protein GY31_08380 [Lysinibacillus sphaericus]POZ57464.1 hypothetical protein LYSIN_02248 [Lysinibacillus sphaericus]
MNYLFQFIVVLLFVLFFHYINQLLLMKKYEFKIQWKSMLILVSLSVVITILLNIGDNGDIQEIDFPI